MHRGVGVGASLVHSMVISVHSFLGLSSVLSTLTEEHSRRAGSAKVMNQITKFSGQLVGYEFA